MNSKVGKKNKSKNILNKVKVFTLIYVFNYFCRYTRERRTLSQNVQPVQVCHMQTSEQSSFMEKETPCIKSESSAEAGYTKSTQTCNHLSVSVDMPEIVIENIKYSEESIIFYTGLPDLITVQAVFEIESLILHDIFNIILIIIYYRTWC